MTIAVLYALGVEAGTILLLVLLLVLALRHKHLRNPALFKARVRLTASEFPGLSSSWKHGYGCWVTTVLLIRTGVAFGIADVIPTARLERIRTATADEAKAIRLGGQSVIATLALTTGATIELAIGADKLTAGLHPYADQATTGRSPRVAGVGGQLRADSTAMQRGHDD